MPTVSTPFVTLAEPRGRPCPWGWAPFVAVAVETGVGEGVGDAVRVGAALTPKDTVFSGSEAHAVRHIAAANTTTASLGSRILDHLEKSRNLGLRLA